MFKAGCVLVNTNPLYTPSETIHQLNDSGAQVLVIVDMFADKLAEVVPKTGLRRVVLAGVSELFPAVPNLVVRGVQRVWSKVLPAVPPLAVPVDRFSQAIHQGHKGTHAHADTSASASADADAATVQSWWFDQPASRIAAQQHTGGTTGVSKGAMLTHANLLANIDQVLATGKTHMGSDECVLTALPLHHIFAFTANLLGFFEIGARNVQVSTPRPVQNRQRASRTTPSPGSPA